MNSYSKTGTSGSKSWICLWLAVWVTAAAFYFWRGAERGSVHRQFETTRASHSAAGMNGVSLATRNIEHIQVGDRVWTDLPESLAEKAIGDLNAVPVWDRLDAQVELATWRRIDLHMDGTDGDHFQIALLRPIAWLGETGAQVGGVIHLTISDQGLDGPATVLAIEPCPPLTTGLGRVVTGTFTHIRGGIVDVFVEGECEPLGVTANHAVYSVDRDAFVYAGDLRIGDRLQTLDGGDVRITTIKHRRDEERVYNLEVHGEHIYRVTASGLLVHNASVKTNLARYGTEPESAASLAEQAANAEAHGFPHGVSTKLTKTPIKSARNANIDDVQQHFPVQQTGRNPDHHTVILPKPITQAIADLFNSLFR